MALEAMGILAQHNVTLASITEQIDYSTPQGKLFMTMLSGLDEFYSDSLGVHVKKGVSARAHQGKHLGGIPFGYQTCYEKGLLQCDVEHPGGLHPVPKEAKAARELFTRDASGTTTLSQLASWLNTNGFVTRNTKTQLDQAGNQVGGPRMFTGASVRGILHNPFYTGKVRHRDQVLPGAHTRLVSGQVFWQVQLNLKRNSGRSETLSVHPEREYLLKGLIKCAYCGMPMWAQTYANGRRYYREQYGTRGSGNCVGRSGSMPCTVPDDQMGKLDSLAKRPV